ncbi:MAG TPA: hypothetical protein VFA61_00155 [Candidatus Udaeobacter sp.]|nr:hypothetical protein [Candidatus Udaeobacter sp.]
MPSVKPRTADGTTIRNGYRAPRVNREGSARRIVTPQTGKINHAQGDLRKYNARNATSMAVTKPIHQVAGWRTIASYADLRETYAGEYRWQIQWIVLERLEHARLDSDRRSAR